MNTDMRRLKNHGIGEGRVVNRWIEKRGGVWYWHGTTMPVAREILVAEGVER